MPQKSYFILPGIFEFFRDYEADALNITVRFSQYNVAGVPKLMNFPVSAGIIQTDDAELSNCNSDMTACFVSPLKTSFNPFYNGVWMDFPIVDGVARGQSTGVRVGAPYSDYGYNDLNLTIDKTQIRNGWGVLSNGSFAIDIDYDQDFDLTIQINVPPSTALVFPYGDGVAFQISHRAETCTSTYTMIPQNGEPQDVFNWGFLLGVGEKSDSEEYHVTPSCVDIIPVDICEGYKTKSRGKLVRVPIVLEQIAIKEDCCFKMDVYAEQTTKTENWKNDFKLLPVQKRQTENDTFVFKLIKCGEDDIILNDDTLGTFVDLDTLENHPDLTYFTVDWFKVLNNGNLGVGTYQFKVEYDVSGSTGEILSCIYDLNVWEETRVDDTVRIESVMDGYLEQIDIDFAGLKLRDCMRVPGFFGLETPEREKKTLKMKNRLKKTIKIVETREYSLEAGPLERCASRHLRDWVFFADELYITDGNILNHDIYRDFPVETPKEIEPDYPTLSRKVIVRAVFEDLNDNKRKLNCT